MGDFYGLRTDTISNGILSVEFLLDAGPRIVRLLFKGTTENILAEIPDKFHETEFGPYFFRGGHRLWRAPEDITKTYHPDNAPIMVSQTSDGVTLIQPVEKATGIQKSIHIRLNPGAPKVTLQHALQNRSSSPVTLSAWAITQLPLGGIAILPQTTTRLDVRGLLPNRNLSLWPYTSINDQRLILADDHILIKANAMLPPLKIGYANRTGWIGYYRNSTLFLKHFAPMLNLPYPDFNCNSELYCCDQFIELETLSPIVTINPGETVIHDETWKIIPSLQPLSDQFAIHDLLCQVSLY